MNRKGKILLLALLFSSLFFTTSLHIPENENNGAVLPLFLSADSSWVDSVYESLSKDERIAQLFMVRAYSNRDEEHAESILRMIRKSAAQSGQSATWRSTTATRAGAASRSARASRSSVFW